MVPSGPWIGPDDRKRHVMYRSISPGSKGPRLPLVVLALAFACESGGDATLTPPAEGTGGGQVSTEAQALHAECATPPPEARTKSLVKERLLERTANRKLGQEGLLNAAFPVTIGVVVHIITNNAGTQGAVTDAQVTSMMTFLNNSFANAFGGAAGTNTNYNFVRAITTRTANTTWFNMTPDSVAEYDAKTALRVGNRAILNVYLANSTSGGTPTGWGAFPWDVTRRPQIDGVVIPTISVTSTPIDTLVAHEVGHWMGLLHTFEGGCTGGDDVGDTEPEFPRATNFACGVVTPDTCGAAGGAPDPINNYMDYSTCRTQFTLFQTSRADTLFQMYRSATHSDILLTGATGWDFLPVAAGQGDGDFWVTRADAKTWGFGSLAAGSAKKLTGDFNRDGVMDLALVGGTNWLSIPVAHSRGGTDFKITNKTLSDIAFGSWASNASTKKVTGDFDGDGRTDVLLLGPDSSVTRFRVAYGRGNNSNNGVGTDTDGDFTVSQLNTIAGSELSAADFNRLATVSGAVAFVGDFDRDGTSDVALTGVSTWQSVPVLFFTAAGPKTTNRSVVSNWGAWSSSTGVAKLAGDFNGDGMMDLALTGVAGWASIPLLTSNGDGAFTFSNAAVGSTWGSTWAVNSAAKKLVGDFDGDLRADIALTGVPGWQSIPVAYGNSDRTFTVVNQVASAFAGLSSTSGVTRLVGDYNGDGTSDIALTGVAGWTSIPVATGLSRQATFTFTNSIVDRPNNPWGSWASTANTSKLVGNLSGN